LGKLSVLGELMRFLAEYKLYWITPIVIVLLLFGILITVMGSSSLFSMLYAF
jgi:hypothetical protein